MGKAKPLQVDGRVWVSGGSPGAPGLGHGRVGLLRAIDEHGSISAAAREIGMSYKAAWEAVESINNLAGTPLVVRETGGKGGGGTRLTPRGRDVLAAFDVVEAAHRRFVAEATAALNGDTLQMLGRIGMKTSARNQLHGRVVRIQRGAVNDEITLDISGGAQLVATITHESTAELALAPGRDVIALIKAPWVLLATGSDVRVSASNRMPGVVSRITRGAVNAEVALTLAGGNTLIAIVTNESIDELALAEGVAATALINASHVLLAVTS